MKSTQKTFNDFITLTSQDNFYKKAIANQGKHFDIRWKQLQKLTPKYIKQQRWHLLSKQKETQEDKDEEWSQSQKKLFSWILLCYLQKHKTTVTHLKDKDYRLLASLSTSKPLGLVRYQIYSMLKPDGRPQWTKAQDQILQKILFVEKKYDTVGMWSQVSRQLFLRGDMDLYKSGKQCRQRWFNHVDPHLNKQWTLNQQLITMKEIGANGKKWAKVVPLLNHTKSEHMVKNKYHSLIKKKQNVTKEDSQDKLIELIIKELEEDAEKAKEWQKEYERQMEKERQIEREKEKEKQFQRQRQNQKKFLLKNSDSLKSDEGTRLTRRVSSLQRQIQKGEMVLLNSQIIQPTTQPKQKQELQWFQPTHLFRQDNHNQLMNPTPVTNDLKIFQSMKFGYASPIPPTPTTFINNFKTNSRQFVSKIRQE